MYTPCQGFLVIYLEEVSSRQFGGCHLVAGGGMPRTGMPCPWAELSPPRGGNLNWLRIERSTLELLLT